MFIDLSGRLKNSQIKFTSRFTQLYLINNDKYFPEIHLVLVVIADEFLIKLTGNLTEITRVCIMEIKFAEIRGKDVELIGCRCGNQ